jgi:hypothetical protein
MVYFADRSYLRRLLMPLALTGMVVLTACSSAASTPPASPTRAPAAASAAPSASAAPAISPVAAAPGSTKVNANTASESEIAQALNAAGVANGARWAREVVEYRPYPTDDANLTKLRQELAKYNPGPGVVDQIVASLTL